MSLGFLLENVFGGKSGQSQDDAGIAQNGIRP